MLPAHTVGPDWGHCCPERGGRSSWVQRSLGLELLLELCARSWLCSAPSRRQLQGAEENQH